MKQKVKEDEMQEKTKRLGELRAQIIGGSECKQVSCTTHPLTMNLGAHQSSPKADNLCTWHACVRRS